MRVGSIFRAERVLAAILIVNVVGIAAGCLWVFMGETLVGPDARYRLHPGSSVQRIALSPDEQLVATSDTGPHVQIWEMNTDEIRRTVKINGHANALQFLTDSRRLFIATNMGDLRILDVNTGKTVRRFTNHGRTTAAAVSHDDMWLVSGDDQGRMRVFDVATGKERTDLADPAVAGPGSGMPRGMPGRGGTLTMRFSHQSPTLVYGDGNGNVHRWELPARKRNTLNQYGWQGVLDVAIHTDDRLIAYADGYRSLTVLNLRGDWDEQKTPVHGWRSPPVSAVGVGLRVSRREWDVADTIRAVAFSPDGGSVLYACGVDRHYRSRRAMAIHVRELPDGDVTARLVGARSTINCMVVAPKAGKVIAGSADGTVYVWSLP